MPTDCDLQLPADLLLRPDLLTLYQLTSRGRLSAVQRQRSIRHGCTYLVCIETKEYITATRVLSTIWRAGLLTWTVYGAEDSAGPCM